MIFGGDIMMGRGLDKYFKVFGYDYPFLKIQDLFLKINWDIVYANLEGPIIKDAPSIKPFSFVFGFSPNIIYTLKKYNFNLLNIANNHITNYGKEGVLSTRLYLKENGIETLGDNYKCDLSYSFKKNNFLFLGINLIPFNQNCVDELINTIKTVKKEKNYFVIVTLHWGNEYQKKPNEYQRKIAHQLIDSGTDLIIGHHPHVIQPIELYHQKLIFYSLGNLVFDQFFSQDTQTSLLIGFEFTPQTQTYYLFPLKSTFGQLDYMSPEEELEFFNKLSENSSPELKEMIKDGKIIIKTLDNFFSMSKINN
ncbi:MAG: CapA family protein [Minisyncoccia bacterium]